MSGITVLACIWMTMFVALGRGSDDYDGAIYSYIQNWQSARCGGREYGGSRVLPICIGWTEGTIQGRRPATPEDQIELQRYRMEQQERNNERQRTAEGRMEMAMESACTQFANAFGSVRCGNPDTAPASRDPRCQLIPRGCDLEAYEATVLRQYVLAEVERDRQKAYDAALGACNAASTEGEWVAACRGFERFRSLYCRGESQTDAFCSVKVKGCEGDRERAAVEALHAAHRSKVAAHRHAVTAYMTAETPGQVDDACREFADFASAHCTSSTMTQSTSTGMVEEAKDPYCSMVPKVCEKDKTTQKGGPGTNSRLRLIDADPAVITL